jgi:hypothetical protein
MNINIICRITKKGLFLVLSAFMSISLNLSHAEVKNNLATFHSHYPDLFISYTSNQDPKMPTEYWLNKQAVKTVEQSLIKPLEAKFNLMLLIDNSKLYSGKEAEGRKNHFLLELITHLEKNPRTLVTFLIDEDITSFDLNRKNILALALSNSPKARITDALALSSQQIRSKYNHQPFIIIVVGSGHNTGNMQYSFMPASPVLYFSSESSELDNSLLSFIIKSSGGFSATIPDDIDFAGIFERLLKDTQNQWHHIAHITVPWYLYRPQNLISLNKTQETSSSTFPSPIIISFTFLLASVGLFIVTFLIFLKLHKKKKREIELKKNKHEFSTAFLHIAHKEQRFEVRISKCEFILGNASTCDCMIDDFDLSASHCMIREKNGLHEIIDLNSRNGVWINGIKIQQHLLCDEDIIGIGNTCILYRQGLINYVSDKKIL